MPSAAASTAAARAVRIALEGTVEPARAALLVHGDHRPFALVGRWGGAAALVGSEPVRVARDDEDPFALLDQQPALTGAPAGFVGGGWFGMLGYGLGRRLETLSPPPPAPERLPDAVLAFHDHVLRLDHDGRWWFEALWTDARADALQRRLDVLRERLAAGVAERGEASAVAPGPWRATPSPAGHARAVAACRERIAAGDLFQANLSLRLRATLQGDPVDLLTRGVAALAPDRAAWLSGPWGAVASLSPELFVERRGDTVRSAPIKGTRPRPADPEAAETQRAELASAAKDRAENVMIVDLMRNDLGRVSTPGSVAVAALAEVRPHAGVWHLVSEVVGRRARGIGDGELVSALFPPGSVTGAPKLAAMDVISELESTARQAFCGAIGFASPAAGLALSVAIRTFECRDGDVWLDVGGGVVADSDPDAEAAECLAKARPLLTAIGATLEVDDAPEGAGDRGERPGDGAPRGGDGSQRAAGPAYRAAGPAGRAAGAAGREAGPAHARRPPLPLRLGVHPTPRPDPAGGVFETVLVRDGAAVAAEDHLARLARSARELYGVSLSPALPALLEHAALEQGGPCRIRIVLGAEGDVALEAAPLPAAGAPATLAPVVVPGGLGAHKWRDRRLVDALAGAVTPALPLLVDLDGGVLETTRANVFVVYDGQLVTPPLDGRILPGVTRARVLAQAATLGIPTRERPLSLDDLATADAILTSGALRGLEATAGIGPTTLPLPDERLRTLIDRLDPSPR
ncbi:MAG TPA: aminodeoxychorismate synthase component I [Baekduia sp.]|uniref:aminodeoxychorismate synthase component I n=1 Tax=Baekduia sp. TaxID=2600305 RepID=UPI002D087F5C|nr:aminodeoxychorismate synthase component I [Baekduia sp.]HMJ32369.1 aminodeoxychorismate synthase component I [Baekduia sp.]